LQISDGTALACQAVELQREELLGSRLLGVLQLEVVSRDYC
jgi:hypothetical protein